jgi:Ca2+-binding RTX toxin-like protein
VLEGVYANLVAYGGSGDDSLAYNGYGTARLEGGEGHDSLYVSNAVGSVILRGNGGDDLLVNDSNAPGTLEGGTGADDLRGGSGDDVLDGGDGDDVIVSDDDDIVINGFAAGANTEDRIDVSGRGLSFEWLMAHASDVDGNAVIDLGDHQLTLNGVSTSMLHNEDFIV